MSEAPAPLFFFKLLLQAAAGSAAELKLQKLVPRPGPLRQCSSGPHLLLPGHTPQRPYQHPAGALAKQIAQNGCAPFWGRGLREGGLSLGTNSQNWPPPFPPTGFPTPGAPSPYSQIPNLAEQTLPEHKTRNPVPCSEVRFSKFYRPYRPYRPSHPKPNPKMRSQGESWGRRCGQCTGAGHADKGRAM